MTNSNLKDLDITKKKIGVLGGGQLGKMLVQDASKMNLDIHILEKDKTFPAAQICANLFQGDFKDYEDVLDFGMDMDILTIEIENVNTDALEELEKQGKHVYPSAGLIKVIKDKSLQKQFLSKHKVPTSPFSVYANKDDLLEAILGGKVTVPFVQKMCTGGYDGKGVQVVRTSTDLDDLFDGASIVEDLIDIDKEISVIVARNTAGDTITYDPVEMQFDDKANLLDLQLCPAQISDSDADKGKKLAIQIANQMNLVGLLAIEMFINKNGDLYVNEMAPRPHNSGHHSIEGCITSQYNQLLRCILGLSLGSTEIVSPSILVNVLGDPDHEGDVIYTGLEEILGMKGVYPHIYGKSKTKPYRKMGHVTILGPNLDACMEKAKKIKKTLKVIT